MSRRWLVSPAFDLGLLVGPAAVALAVAFALPPGLETPPWLWLALVVGIDVAHVYASLWRTYWHPVERAERAGLLLAAPVLALVGSALLCAVSTALFWTVLAYVAVWHFIKQQIGFVALYRLRAGLPTRSPAARLERAVVWALCGVPVLWWHAHLPRSFTWFLEGDFLPGLPMPVLHVAGALGVGIVGAHAAVRLRSGEPVGGRDLWLVTTGAVWFGGIVFTDGDLAFTATNVVLHGVPYLALVAWIGGREEARALPFTRRGLARGALFLLPLLALALVEEGLWDALVWHDHEGWFGAWSPSELTAAVAVPLLAVPQVTHYLLDGAIWKLGPGQERLRAAILSEP